MDMQISYYRDTEMFIDMWQRKVVLYLNDLGEYELK